MEQYEAGTDATYYARNVCYLRADSNFREWYVQHLGVDNVERVQLVDGGPLISIHDPRVPQPTIKTRASVEEMMESVEDARLLGDKAYHDRVEQTGYYGRHVFARLPYFNPVIHYINDSMHKMYNTVKIIFQYIAHQHFDKTRHRAFFNEHRRFSDSCVDQHHQYTDDDEADWIDTNTWAIDNKRHPWQASKENIFNIVDSERARRIPGEHTGKLGCPFKTTYDKDGKRKFSLRKMQSSDWMHLAGPIGIYYIEMTDIHPRYKMVFQDLLRCFYDMRYHALNTTDLDDATANYDSLRWYRECAAILEYLMPINFNHINQHVWQHAISELVYAGPVFGHHMFPFEAGAGWLKSLLKSPKSPEEGLARSIAAEWRTMLHKYDEQDVDTITRRLLAPKYRGRTPQVIDYISYPQRMPEPKRRDTPATRAQIAADNAVELKLLHNYFLENDIVSKMVQDEFIRMHGGHTSKEWKKFNIKNWVVDEQSFNRIDQHHMREFGLHITRQVIEHVKVGPIEEEVMTYKKIKINDTDFCDVVTDGNFKTTNSCVRYTVNNGKNAWTYAQIKCIYRARPHAASTEQVTLFRFINYRKPRSYKKDEEDSSGLVPIEQMSDDDVVDTVDHLFVAPVHPECVVDDENLAFWPALAADEFYVVSYNTLKTEPDRL
jgi:hypothetical protein